MVRALAGVYGGQAAQETGDATWLALAGERGWVVLCQGDRIRRRPAEPQALSGGEVRLSCPADAQLAFAGQAGWFPASRHRILQVSRKPGPYVDGSCRDRTARLGPG